MRHRATVLPEPATGEVHIPHESAPDYASRAWQEPRVRPGGLLVGHVSCTQDSDSHSLYRLCISGVMNCFDCSLLLQGYGIMPQLRF